jgi:hypothetical protein
VRKAAPLGKATAVLVLLGILCWEFRRPLFLANFGVVDPDRVFRSAQPTDQLDRWIKEYQVRSILNLRGGTPADRWYQAELSTSQARGVLFYDLPLSAIRRPGRRELLWLIDVLGHCRYPLLIHCKSGADRTGLASALYLLMQRGEPPERAENAFSLAFGHLPLFGTEHLHEPLREYAAWLKSRRLAHTPEQFRAWVRSEYRAPDAKSDPAPLQPGPRVRRP